MTTIVEKCPMCGGDAIDRSEFWEASPDNGSEIEQELFALIFSIRKFKETKTTGDMQAMFDLAQ